jgi:cobalt-precorrin 5A hydrolase
MKAGIIAFTERGFTLGTQLAEMLENEAYQVSAYRCGKDTLRSWTSSHFDSDEALVFIGAAGIAVRAIAPHLKSKTCDPAVLVIDEHGKFVIPVLSGHIGGANKLGLHIAKLLRALPVITTATDCNSIFAVDSWASERGIKILNPEKIKWASARLLAGEYVYLKSFFPVEGGLPDGIVLTEEEYDVVLTVRSRGRRDALRLVPPILTLGLGCQRGTTADALEEAFELILKKGSCYREAVYQAASIDLKADESGLLAFCHHHNLPLKTFSAEELGKVKGRFSSSEFVKKTTGVDNVCERSAVLASGGELYVKKNAGNGITMALAISPYSVRFVEE